MRLPYNAQTGPRLSELIHWCTLIESTDSATGALPFWFIKSTKVSLVPRPSTVHECQVVKQKIHRYPELYVCNNYVCLNVCIYMYRRARL